MNFAELRALLRAREKYALTTRQREIANEALANATLSLIEGLEEARTLMREVPRIGYRSIDERARQWLVKYGESLVGQGTND